MLEELLWRQIARLSPIEDRLGDIRREIAEADEAGEVGPANTFALGECSKGDAFALGECRVELARPEKQLYQSRVRFRGGKRIGAVDHHSDLPPGAAQPYRHGQDLGFIVGLTLRWCSSYIEERGQPRRAETDVDLVDAHLDAFDQGCEHSTLAGHGHLGPARADVCSPRDKLLLHRSVWEPCRSRFVDAAGIEKPSVHPAAHEMLDLRGRNAP